MANNKKAPTVATVKASNTAITGGDFTTQPNPNTQAARLFDALQAGQKIDPLEAWLELGIYRLASAVHLLKHTHGVNIKKETTKAKNRFGEVCNFACYSLQRDEVAQ